MKLSSSSVFLILLGIFILFCLFSHVKSRYIEGFDEDNEESIDYDDEDVPINTEATLESEMIKNNTLPSPDFEHRIGQKDPRLRSNTLPSFMNTTQPSKVEAFENNTPTATSLSPTLTSSSTTAAKTSSPTAKLVSEATYGSNLNVKNYLSSFGTIISNLSSTGSLTSVGSSASSASMYPTPLPQSCARSMYGCCPDAMTVKNADGSNCFANSTAISQTTRPMTSDPTNMQPGVSGLNTNTVLIPPPVGNSAISNVCPPPPECPACARCPEPAYDCKKVPNYNAQQEEANETERFLPQPVLSDFSSFGM